MFSQLRQIHKSYGQGVTALCDKAKLSLLSGELRKRLKKLELWVMHPPKPKVLDWIDEQVAVAELVSVFRENLSTSPVGHKRLQRSITFQPMER